MPERKYAVLNTLQGAAGMPCLAHSSCLNKSIIPMPVLEALTGGCGSMSWSHGGIPPGSTPAIEQTQGTPQNFNMHWPSSNCVALLHGQHVQHSTGERVCIFLILIASGLLCALQC